MTGNRTTELLDGLRHVRNLHEFAKLFGFNWYDDSDWTWHDVALKMADDFEQAISATLGKPKAKAHPYGYEPDTGAFDCTRCECGCINDISATYCNDCGGEIEVDMNAEKELYHHSRNSVFAEKHDDGSLEFGGKRYIAATLGSERGKALEELESKLEAEAQHAREGWELAMANENRIAELIRCLENDWNIRASWDGLRKFWCIELTEEGVKLRDEWNARAERTCKPQGEWERTSQTQEIRHIYCECGEYIGEDRRESFPFAIEAKADLPNYCPNCGAKVIGGDE